MRTHYRLRRIVGQIVLYTILLVIGLVILFPVLWALLSSLKTNREIFQIPTTFFPSRISLENYQALFREFKVFRLLGNSLIYAGVTTITCLFFSTLIGYGFAKFRSKFMDILFNLILTSIMVPFFTRFIPLYIGMVKIGGDNTFWGLILPNYLSVFGIFFMRQYCMTIPDELLQAARMDGAHEIQILWKIVFPLMKSACATLTVIKFIDTWNDFLWPLVMLSDKDKMTFSIALATYIDPMTMTRFGPILAGGIIMLLPVAVLFLILQRQVVESVAMSGFKS